MRVHLERAAELTGRRPAELDGPDLPEAIAYVWGWYLELDAARSGNGWAPNPLGYGEIAAWAKLTGRRPTRFEVAVLRALDGVFFRQVSKDRALRAKRRTS